MVMRPVTGPAAHAHLSLVMAAIHISILATLSITAMDEPRITCSRRSQPNCRPRSFRPRPRIASRSRRIRRKPRWQDVINRDSALRPILIRFLSNLQRDSNPPQIVGLSYWTFPGVRWELRIADFGRY